jgi:aminoglycoside phosphotransferase (APT) family kinase protein
MATEWLNAIPEAQRDSARAALAGAFGSGAVSSIQPVVGGASGALAYRLELNDRAYLMRLETRRSPLRNPHQYACMQIAADAGIAPPMRYADDAAGVAILDFVAQHPLSEYPGGAARLAAAVGSLAAELRRSPPFPQLGDYRIFLDRMLAYLRGAFVPGLLDPHFEVFERIRRAYPWDASTHVSSHNDPNPTNILFDGERLWLIDWETSYRNDPLTDVAILTENFAQTHELEEVLTQSCFGVPPGKAVRARLALMRRLTRLYYAGLLFASSMTTPAGEPMADLSAPTPGEFRARVTSGQLTVGTTEPKLILGKMFLAGFLAGTDATDFQEALLTCKGD